MKLSARELVPMACRIAIAAVFLWAAVTKLLDPGSFAADVQNYRVLPEQLVRQVALFVPAFELIVALGLLTPRYQRGAALIATCMLVAFSVAMAQARMRGIDLSCGCFGAAFESKVSWLTVARSGFLAIVAALPLFFPRTRSHDLRTPASGGTRTV